MTMNLLLKCNSIEETRAFYSDVLRFDVSDTAEGTCSVQKAGGTVIFSTGEHLSDSPAMTGTIYFFVPDVDKCFEAIKDNVNVQWPLQNMPYGTREFGIKDCNGYHLAFAEDREI